MNRNRIVDTNASRVFRSMTTSMAVMRETDAVVANSSPLARLSIVERLKVKVAIVHTSLDIEFILNDIVK